MIFALFLALIEGPIDLSRLLSALLRMNFITITTNGVASNHCRLIKNSGKIAHHSIGLCCRV